SLGVVFPKRELLAQMNSLHRRTVLLAAGGLILLLVVSGLVARSIARPLRRMAAATDQVAQGDLDIDLSDIHGEDEVGQLAQSFMRMTHGLKERDRIRDTFGRYLTREVVNRLLESKDGLRLGGENREITMIMSDLRGFTALTSSMPPQQVLAFLNRYLGKMVEILIDYQGTIDEIVGDGILAFFGAPEPLEDHPARAVACALKMQAAMDEVNSLNEADGLPRLDMGVAVNTGTVVVGNIGSEKRTKYGAVGSQVNFTGRMESFTVGGQVLISSSTYERLSEFLDIRNVLQVEMKGVPGKITLYDVRGIKGPYDAHLPDRDETPVPLESQINVKVYRLDQKILAGDGTTAIITHISLTSAVMIFDYAIGQWEDIRIVILSEEMAEVPGAVYAKVVSTAEVKDGWEATVRFTSVSPEAYRMFREAVKGA
ncbi:MAG: adenylate/guanylate cyclase domain-containing protein, partial [Desulfomonilaceae bacterium]